MATARQNKVEVEQVEIEDTPKLESVEIEVPDGKLSKAGEYQGTAPPLNPRDGYLKVIFYRGEHSEHQLYCCVNGTEEKFDYDVPVKVHPSLLEVIKQSVRPIRVNRPGKSPMYRLHPTYAYSIIEDHRRDKSKVL